MTIFEARTSKEVIKVKWGHVGGLLSNRISILLRRDTTWAQKKSYVRVLGGGGLEERSHEEANPAGTLILDTPAFSTSRNKLLLFKPKSMVLLWQPKQTKIPHLPPCLFYQESSACCLWWVSVSYVHVKGLTKEGIGCCWPPFRSNPCQSNSSSLHTPVRSRKYKVEVYQTHSRWLSFNSW